MTEGVVVELYVVRGALNSRHAVANLNAWLLGRFGGHPPRVDVIEVFEQPHRALAAGVWLTPQLIVRGAAGDGRLVGTMDDPIAFERVIVPLLDAVP